jgi:hypothetical protein
MATGNGQAARQQCRFTGEPAIFFRQVNGPHFFSVIGVHRFHGTFAVSRIDNAVSKRRMKVGIEITNTIAHGDIHAVDGVNWFSTVGSGDIFTTSSSPLNSEQPLNNVTESSPGRSNLRNCIGSLSDGQIIYFHLHHFAQRR